jgi:cell division protein FtsX
MDPAPPTFSLRPTLWIGLGIVAIGLLIVAYAMTVYFENVSSPPPWGFSSAPLLPLGTLGLGLAILVIGLVTAIIGKRAKDVWPP